jgi:hypothetical protein
MKRTMTIALAVALLGLPMVARADDGQAVARGAGSAFGTLVYTPVKTSFCILGAIGGGFTYMVDSKTGAKVARGACGGTWVITPSAVGGSEPVHFVGNTAPDGDQRSRVASAPQTQQYAPSKQKAPSTQK